MSELPTCTAAHPTVGNGDVKSFSTAPEALRSSPPSSFSDAGGPMALSDGAGGGAAAEAEAPASLMTRVFSKEYFQGAVFGVLQRTRPWSEFLNTKAMSVPQLAELRDRVWDNLRLYLYNYIVIFVLLTALAVLTNPLCLLGLMLIFAAYMVLFVYNPHSIKVGSVELDSAQKKAVVLVAFGCVIGWLTGAGATLSGLIVVVGVLAGVHAALRRSPNEADFETAFSPNV